MHAYTRMMGAGCLCLIALITLGGCDSSEEEGVPEWGYEAENGPLVWAQLKPEYAQCAAGTRQSPINLTNATPRDLPDLVFDYEPSALHILNNGHTIEVEYDEGSSLEIEDASYELVQFHFHSLSEHTIDGRHAALEMHLVHRSEEGRLAVVGVQIEQGAENASFAPVWQNLPARVSEEATTVSGATILATDLLPADRRYYRYDGSLTTPACGEGVSWFVLQTPVSLSAAQIAAFRAFYPGNYRPVQSLNGREVLLDTSAD